MSCVLCKCCEQHRGGVLAAGQKLRMPVGSVVGLCSPAAWRREPAWCAARAAPCALPSAPLVFATHRAYASTDSACCRAGCATTTATCSPTTKTGPSLATPSEWRGQCPSQTRRATAGAAAALPPLESCLACYLVRLVSHQRRRGRCRGGGVSAAAVCLEGGSGAGGRAGLVQVGAAGCDHRRLTCCMHVHTLPPCPPPAAPAACLPAHADPPFHSRDMHAVHVSNHSTPVGTPPPAGAAAST